MDKLELAERVENATGPSFALFADAFEAIYGGRSSLGEKWSAFCALCEAEAWLDAALTLVPEGCSFDLSKDHYRDGGKWVCTTGPDDHYHTNGRGMAATPALALCAAALRARAEGGKS